MVDCHLIYLSFGIVVHLLSAASFLFPLQNTPSYSYIFAPWNAGSPPVGKLAQVSILVPDQLEFLARLGYRRTRLGRARYKLLGR